MLCDVNKVGESVADHVPVNSSFFIVRCFKCEILRFALFHYFDCSMYQIYLLKRYMAINTAVGYLYFIHRLRRAVVDVFFIQY